MAVRNFEEYRAEVLEQLGATAEDLRNEPSWRAKVLEALGAEYTDEDTRNFERYRLKVLENLSGGGGSSWQTVFEGSVETVDDDGDIFGIIENLTLNGDSIKATLNGTEYILPKTEHGYGAENESGLDFSTYPLFIAPVEGVDSCNLWTPTAGTYTLKIEEPQSGGSSGEFKIANITWANLPETFDDYDPRPGVLMTKTEEGFEDYTAVYEFSEIIIVWDDAWDTPPKAVVTTKQPENVGDLAVWLHPYPTHNFSVVSGDAFTWNRGVIIYGDCTLTIS